MFVQMVLASGLRIKLQSDQGGDDMYSQVNNMTR